MARKIATMRRAGLVRLLRSMDCGFRIDFSDEYLKSMSIDRLRHVVLAASLHDHSACQGDRSAQGPA